MCVSLSNQADPLPLLVGKLGENLAGAGGEGAEHEGLLLCCLGEGGTFLTVSSRAAPVSLTPSCQGIRMCCGFPPVILKHGNLTLNVLPPKKTHTLCSLQLCSQRPMPGSNRSVR